MNEITFEVNNGFSDEEREEIELGLKTLLSVVAGTQPIDREFGIDIDNIVSNIPDVAKNLYTIEVSEKVAKYEPRVEVEDIIFKSDGEGTVISHIIFSKAEVSE